MPTLTQPAIGSTAWGGDMNANLQALQTQLTNAMQGRVAFVSSTQIALQRYVGDTVEVGGLNVSIGSGGIALNTTDNLITSTGADAGAAMAASSLYYVYLSNSSASPFPTQLRASTTAPTFLNGVKYLGASGNAANWRFVGWVRTNASTQFQDDITGRLVVNYYNRLDKHLMANPGYVNDNADTTYAMSGNWAKANGGTNSTISLISNGEDASFIQVQAIYNTGAGQTAHAGPGIDGTAPTKIGSGYTSTVQTITVNDSQVLSEGYHTVDLYLATTGAGTVLFYADRSRLGAASDPRCSLILGIVKA